jgi:hypothetical protein
MPAASCAGQDEFVGTKKRTSSARTPISLDITLNPLLEKPVQGLSPRIDFVRLSRQSRGFSIGIWHDWFLPILRSTAAAIKVVCSSVHCKRLRLKAYRQLPGLGVWLYR